MREIFAFITGRRTVWVILVGCILALAAATAFVPRGANTSSESRAVSAGDSQRVDELLTHFPSAGTSYALILWSRSDGGTLTSADRNAIDATVPALGAMSVASSPARPEISVDRKAMLLRVQLNVVTVDADAAAVVGALHDAASRHLTPALRLGLDGTVVASADNQSAQSRTNLWVLLVVSLIVAGVMFLLTRKPLAWLAEIVVIGASVWISFVVGGAVCVGLAIPFSTGAGTILMALVLCVTAGFCLIVNRWYRHESHTTPDARDALRKSLLSSWRAVAVGTLVLVAGLAPMTFARASETRALGVSGPIAAVLAAVLSLVMLPALFAILGAASVRPARVRTVDASAPAFRPIATGLISGAILCLIGVGLVASGLAPTALSSTTTIAETSPTQRQIDQRFVVGYGNRAVMLVPRSLGGSTSSTSPNFTAMLLPSVKSVVLVAKHDGRSALIVAMDANPGSAKALLTIERLRRELASTGGGGASTLVGGPDASTIDARNAARADLATVLPITAAILLVALVVGILGERRYRTSRARGGVKSGRLVP